jgi:AraC family transcriptional regulator
VANIHAWESIQKTLELIEERIDEEIPILELANAAALSPFYYQRLFARLVRKPLREYIKLRRLARASETLRNGNDKILDVAIEYGFGSHEFFSRTFKDAYGMTPTQYRESDVQLNNYDMPDLLLNYVMIDVGVPLINDGLVLEINRIKLEQPINFMGIHDYAVIDEKFPNGEVTGVCQLGEIWRRFHQRESTIPALPKGRKIGVAYHGDAPAGCFSYFVGAETESMHTGENLKIWQLPAGEYLVVGFEAETFEELVTTALNKAVKYSHEWQKKKNMKFADFGAEIYYSETEQGVAYMEMWSLWLE